MTKQHRVTFLQGEDINVDKDAVPAKSTQRRSVARRLIPHDEKIRASHATDHHTARVFPDRSASLCTRPSTLRDPAIDPTPGPPHRRPSESGAYRLHRPEGSASKRAIGPPPHFSGMVQVALFRSIMVTPQPWIVGHAAGLVAQVVLPWIVSRK